MAATTWTFKLAAARTERRLKALKSRAYDAAIAIARDWGDVDEYIVGLADQIRDALDAPIDEMRDAIKERLAEEARSKEP